MNQSPIDDLYYCERCGRRDGCEPNCKFYVRKLAPATKPQTGSGLSSVRKVLIVGRLAEYGIKTLGDLDRWRNAQRWQDAEGEYIPSRYKALKAIVGEDAADLILNELAILQCTGIEKGRAA